MNRPLLFLSCTLFSLLLLQPAFAQPDLTPKTAITNTIGVSDAALIEKLMVTVPGVGRNAREMLRQQSVKSYMMPVRQRGIRGTDLSYTLASCLEFYVNLDKNYKVNLSPDYISLSLKNLGKRVNVESAFRFLVNDGTVSAAILPYDAASLTTGVYATQKYKINNFLYLFRTVTTGRQKIHEVRKALMRGNPVLVELKADESIKELIGDRYWKPSKSTKQLYPLIVVGYNESNKVFELRSCWGSKWGNNGHIWISYDDFGKYVGNGYVIVPKQRY